MRVFIVYCHPSEDSFTKNIRDAFIKGITDSGNEYVISDLYKMDFNADMSEQEYLRDANYRNTPDVAADVLAEHEKINSSDAIAFIYPVFWTEAPAINIAKAPAPVPKTGETDSPFTFIGIVMLLAGVLGVIFEIRASRAPRRKTRPAPHVHGQSTKEDE